MMANSTCCFVMWQVELEADLGLTTNYIYIIKTTNLKSTLNAFVFSIFIYTERIYIPPAIFYAFRNVCDSELMGKAIHVCIHNLQCDIFKIFYFQEFQQIVICINIHHSFSIIILPLPLALPQSILPIIDKARDTDIHV